MEIKVTCGCGTKYKFDVEPVNKRMPWPVSCPSCGADGTAQANDIIQQDLTAGLPPPPPVAVALPASPVGLRISAAPPPVAPAPSALPARVSIPTPAPAPTKQSSAWVRVGSIVLVVLVAASVTYRLVRKVSRVINIVSAIANATSDEEDQNWNLTADNEVIVYLRYTNHQDVADACTAYFHQQLHRNLRRKTPDQENSEGQEFFVLAPYHDYVEFMGELGALKEPELAGLAQHLSGKFNTLAFVEQDVDATGACVFGVYEQGTNQFYAHMDVRMQNGEPVEIVTTQGDEWALAHGFKPGTNGFKEFNIKDADELTKNCGMKIWDRDEERTTNDVVLKEWGASQ